MERLHLSEYLEIAGKGIVASVHGHELRLGSAKLVLDCDEAVVHITKVHLMIDKHYLGYFAFAHHYREGLEKIAALEPSYQLFLLSGDQDHERYELVHFFKDTEQMFFNQSPQNKLDFIKSLQLKGGKVMMIGDGLNDSGALKQSDLGIAVTDNVNNFSPGSDAIIDGKSFNKLPAFLRFSKDTVSIIHFSFLISLTYNLVGLSYAITGNMSPLTAAILMPLSTVTIISFTSLATHLAAKRRKLI
jgi:Cu+-exporting ATPase